MAKSSSTDVEKQSSLVSRYYGRERYYEKVLLLKSVDRQVDVDLARCVYGIDLGEMRRMI
ncbi:hypothetical protein T01_4417 [Trichinella spiralis]|uniref:Uncharacterized protein n=1 Tax=Trichinella spiralis TaxID=6334 RepID=A0A0V1AU02_TRISP|nr:hypothetical protein T01_4417 [Trichinella spiralis]